MPNPYQNPADETQLYTDLQTCVGDPTCWTGINHYNYSNFGYAVLGNVLSDHDGAGEWSRDNSSNVMLPLGMFVLAAQKRAYEGLVRAVTAEAVANPRSG